jgi:hypothetical protein
LKITSGSFIIFLKIHEYIRKSRCTTDINNTGGKFATSANNTDGKFATGVNYIGGKFATRILLYIENTLKEINTFRVSVVLFEDQQT